MYLLIYLVALYENIIKMLIIFTVFAFILIVPLGLLSVFYFSLKYDNGEDITWEHLYRRFLKIYCYTVCAIVSLHIFLPAPIYLYTMTGVYVGEQLLDNDKVNTLVEKSVKTLELKLDKTIQELNENLQSK